MKQNHHNIQKSLDHARSFLAKEQHDDGSFPVFRRETIQKKQKSFQLETPFATSCIALCLSHDRHPLSVSLVEKSVSFLLKQKSSTWTWNYWNKTSKEYKTTPYPDDLDDTYLALSAIFLHDQSLFKGSVLNHSMSHLTSCETNIGGPYTTWIVPKKAPKAWRDVDIVVNANIGYFLSLFDVELLNLHTFYEQSLKTNTITSPYYVSQYPALYALSRVVKGNAKELLIHILETKQHTNGTWGTPLHTALALTSLSRLCSTPKQRKKAITYLLNSQQKNGSWNWEAYYVDAGLDKQRLHPVGSEALTTAFISEALNHVEQTQQTPSIPSKQHIHFHLTAHIQQRVINTIVQWSQEGYTAAKPILDTLLTHDMAEQLVLLPYLFWQTIDKKYTKQIKYPDQFLKTLGEATLYGWIAYTIIDNVLDNEPNPLHISTALYAHRQMGFLFTHAIEQETSLSFHTRLKRQSLLNTLFHTTMNTLDRANQWEVTYARINPDTTVKDIKIPMYTKLSITISNDVDKTIIAPSLADRSIGHALGPLAICMALGRKPNNKEIKHLLTLFRCYLTARQLNDDAHDWEEDLTKGHLTAVTSALLASYRSAHPKSKQTIQTLLASGKLKTHFWEELIPDISRTIENRCKKGTKTVRTIPFINNYELFDTLFQREQKAAIKARNEQQQVKDFLHHMVR
jgi:hypothetical protein